jgi:hypothetical protein
MRGWELGLLMLLFALQGFDIWQGEWEESLILLVILFLTARLRFTMKRFILQAAGQSGMKPA